MYIIVYTVRVLTTKILVSIREYLGSIQFSSVTQSHLTLWTAARKASLSIFSSQNLLKLMSIESVMPSSHLILCHPLLLLPSILPSIRVFSSKSNNAGGLSLVPNSWKQLQSILFRNG